MAQLEDKDFANRIEDLAERAQTLYDYITTEEATKQNWYPEWVLAFCAITSIGAAWPATAMLFGIAASTLPA